VSQDPGQRLLKQRPLVAAVGVEFAQEREQAKQGGHQQHAAIAILYVGGMDDREKQQTLRVYKQMALLALDRLARVVAMPVDRAPFFRRS